MIDFLGDNKYGRSTEVKMGKLKARKQDGEFTFVAWLFLGRNLNPCQPFGREMNYRSHQCSTYRTAPHLGRRLDIKEIGGEVRLSTTLR